LRIIGVDPTRVGLAFGLAVRFVPVLASVAADIREAQAARGLDRSVFALAVPLTLRTLRMADEIAEAIDARS
jgi:biotin transport system permease protein